MNNEQKLSVRSLRALLRRARAWHLNGDLAASGLSQARQIHTFTHPEELTALYRLAADLPDGARILEVGSYLGASTCFLAAGLRGRRGAIVCVDTWENQTMPDGVRDTFAEFAANTRGVADRITTIRKRSDQISADMLGEPFHLIFLDGDHSYSATRCDFQLAASVLRADGVIAFHDSLAFQGVSRVVGEVLATGDWMLGEVVQNLCWVRRETFAKKL